MTKKLTKVAMTTALAAAAIVPAVVATPAQAAEAEVTLAKAYYTTANGTAAFDAGKLSGVIGATKDTNVTYVEASNGEVFDMKTYSAYFAAYPTATPNEILTALSKAGKALSADQVKALDVKEGKVEGGKVTVDPTAVQKTALNEAIAKAEASPKAAELKDAIAAAKAVAAKADATQAEVDAAVKVLNEAIAKAEAATELKVESVSAINLTSIEVKFNQAVDKTSAETIGNYALALASNNNTISLTAGTPAYAKLQADGKTVKIFLGTGKLTNQVNHKLTINGVRATDKVKKVEDKVVEFAALDITTPSVLSVESNGLRQIKVTFSEDVTGTATSTNFKLNGKALTSYGVGSITFDRDTNTATIPFALDLPVGANELEVSVDNNIADFVPLKVLSTKKSFTVAEDTSALSISKAEVIEVKTGNELGLTQGKYVKVTFNKPLSYDGLVVNSTRTSSGANVANIFLNGSTADARIIAGNLYVANGGSVGAGTATVANGTQLVRIDQQNLNDTNTANDFYVVDTSGVKLPTNSTVSVTVDVDTVKPTVEAVSVEDSNKLVVRFSEDVTKASAESLANYTLRNAKGEVVTLSNPQHNYDSLGENIVRFTVAAGLEAQNYTLEVKDVQDKATNKTEAVTKTFNPGDVIAPKLSGATANESDRTVYVKFSKSINVTDLTNRANYTIGGKALPASATVEAQQDNKVLKIVLPSSFVTTDLGGTIVGKKVVVANIKDANGNKLAGLYEEATIASLAAIAVTPFKDSADLVRVTDSRTIQLNLNTQLAELDPSNFDVKIGAVSVPVLATSTFVNNSTGSVVTLKLGSDITSAATATNLAGALTVDVVAAKGTKGLDESKITTAASLTANVVDKIAPTVLSVKQKTINPAVPATGADDTFTVLFSEAVTFAAGYKNDLVVKDLTTGQQLELADFTVTPDPNSGPATSFDVKITKNGLSGHKFSIGLNNGRFITDGATNQAKTFADKVVRNQGDTEDAIIKEFAAPKVKNVTSTLADGSYKAGTVIPVTVTFDEAVTVTGTPKITLADGASTKANYASGSGTTSLVFNYTVPVGGVSSDLATTADITLNGGTIVGSEAVAIASTGTGALAASGAGSLVANKAIVIDGILPALTASSATIDNTYDTNNGAAFTLTFAEAPYTTAAATTKLVEYAKDATRTSAEKAALFAKLFSITGLTESSIDGSKITFTSTGDTNLTVSLSKDALGTTAVTAEALQLDASAFYDSVGNANIAASTITGATAKVVTIAVATGGVLTITLP